MSSSPWTHSSTAIVPSGPSPRRVLVVDDERDTVDSLAMLLGILGHEVQVAYDGASALSLAAVYRPELVLLDIAMPGTLNGYEVAQSLRQLAGSEEMVLIAVTGYGQPKDLDRAHAAGFDHHLLKPFGLNELQALLAMNSESCSS